MQYKDQSVDLIYLKTDKFLLTIKGKPVHPDIEQRCYANEDKDAVRALMEINSNNTTILELHYFEPDSGLYKDVSIEENSFAIMTYPVFYEQQDYQVYIEARDDSKLEFYHENRYIRNSVSRIPYDNNKLMGNINFRNDVGYSELEIRGDGRTLVTLKIEVYPSKIDYRRDYYNIIQEINREVYNLAYDFLRRTFQDMRIREAGNISHAEFFSILITIFNKFEKAFRRIESSPHHHLYKYTRVLPSARVKKIDRQGIKWVRKNPQFYDIDLKLPVRMLNVDKRASFDTFENRFVKWIILQLKKKLREFKKRYKQINKDRIDGRVLIRISRVNKKLNSMLDRTFLEEVGQIYKIDSLSLVLQMAPGYREVYKYYLMLMKGLTLNGELFKLSMKRIWELYEYWSFLELNRILRNKYKLIKSNLIDINYSGIYVTLNKSRSAAVQYQHPDTGELFALTYNTSEGEGITTGQKPDNVLTLEKKDTSVKYKFIFDAKYRINPAYSGTDYNKIYHTPGPEEETINTMHRYRDAIVYNNHGDYERTMVGAYVLFPYHNEAEFQNHRFYQSIEKVNVGAFPFLPGSNKLITDFLEGIISESSLSNFERNILPKGTVEYRSKRDFKQNVLVGSLKAELQLDFLLMSKFYHIPCRQVKLDKFNLKYIAVYQSKKKFPNNYGVRYYGKIKSMEVLKRKDINIPTKSNLNEPYYVFYIEEWLELKEPILPEGYGVTGSHIYTNDMLLKKASTIPELSVKTLKEWRVWLELKRYRDVLKRKISVLTESNNLNPAVNIESFVIGNIKIKIKEGYVSVTKEGTVVKKEYKDFIRNIRGVMKSLF